MKPMIPNASITADTTSARVNALGMAWVLAETSAVTWPETGNTHISG